MRDVIKKFEGEVEKMKWKRPLINIEELVIANGTCDSDFSITLEHYAYLKSIKIGDKSFSIATSFIIRDCKKLMSITVGKRSFMAEAATSGVISISDCPMLRTFNADIFAFQRFNLVTFSSKVFFILLI